ncbi:hypothetical protein [Paraburkholderia sp. DGU8]|uniref:hypothetical protein n=1 Tax=Paraburkholderia sp. DGU8 TaxID=3161997 RepID=UPI0034657BFA
MSQGFYSGTSVIGYGAKTVSATGQQADDVAHLLVRVLGMRVLPRTRPDRRPLDGVLRAALELLDGGIDEILPNREERGDVGNEDAARRCGTKTDSKASINGPATWPGTSGEPFGMRIERAGHNLTSLLGRSHPSEFFYACAIHVGRSATVINTD